MTLRILLLSIFVFQGCGAPSGSQKEVARVGRAVLLERDLPVRNGANPDQVSDVVNQWVAEEILFEHASNSGFENSGASISSLDAFKRRAAGQR